MTEILVSNRGEFYDLIENNRVVALFTAPTWCVPCRQFEPHWTKAAEQVKDLLFVKVDMGESPEATGEHWASKDFFIRGVPTVLLFDDADNYKPIKSRAVVPLIKELTA